jgi:hypothetical protein
MPTNEQIETLAAAIGEEVYIDVAKWHLYLRDTKLHTVLAERLLPMLQSGKVDEDAATEVLRQIPVSLGGGRTQLTLLDLLPMQGILTLLDVLERYVEEWK